VRCVVILGCDNQIMQDLHVLIAGEDDIMPTLVRPQHQSTRYKEFLGEYLKKHRLEKGLSQQEMLERVGKETWFTNWSAYERGERNLPADLWEPVAQALGIPAQEFAAVFLRYTHPWAYGMIYGFDAALRAELKAIPSVYDDVRQHRAPRSKPGKQRGVRQKATH
jgi:transcriptional regulator with XRE-family HTH domain